MPCMRDTLYIEKERFHVWRGISEVGVRKKGDGDLEMNKFAIFVFDYVTIHFPHGLFSSWRVSCGFTVTGASALGH